MDAFLFCLAALLKPRVHAALRRDFPLLYFLPFLLLGQLAGELCGWASLPGALWVVWISRVGGVLRGACVAVIAGIVTVCAAVPREPEALPAEGVTVVAQVEEPPRYPRVGEATFIARISAVHPTGPLSFAPFRARCTAVQLPWRNSSKIAEGATMLLQGRFTYQENSRWPFDFGSTLRRAGITALCKVRLVSVLSTASPSWRQRLSTFVCARVNAVLGDGERAGLLLSMGLGVRDVISERTEWAFKATGLAHVLVVSGCQVTLVFAVVVWLLRYFVGLLPQLYRQQVAHTAIGWIAGAVSVTFIYLVGLEGSTLRAGLALLFCLLALQFERRGGMINAVLVSGTVISVLWPGAAFEPGVELTYAALGGILLGSSSQRGIKEYLVVSSLATTATGLVALLWFGNISLFGFVLNPWLAPLLGLLSCHGGGVATILHLFGIDQMGCLLRLVAWGLEQGRDVVLWCAEIPWAQCAPQQWWERAVVAGMLLAVLGARFVCRFNQWVIASGVD